MAGPVLQPQQQTSCEETEEEEYFHEAETRSLQAAEEPESSGSSRMTAMSMMTRMQQQQQQQVQVQVQQQGLEAMVAEIFSTVSALKSAYIQLQAAHSPYDQEKLRVADRMVIAELRKLSEMKHAFRSSKHKPVGGGGSSGGRSSSSGRRGSSSSGGGGGDAQLLLARKVGELQHSLAEKQALVESYERYAEACRKEIAEKDEEIEQIKESCRRASAKKEKLERKLKELISSGNSNNRVKAGVPPLSSAAAATTGDAVVSQQVFEAAARAVRQQAFSFAQLLMGLMREAGWDLEAAAASIQPGVALARPGHARFAFRSYVCNRMFNGFENENFYLSGSLSSILDPERHRQRCWQQFVEMQRVEAAQLAAASSSSSSSPGGMNFGRFCQRKYLSLVHERMEESFFGSLQTRSQVMAGQHPIGSSGSGGGSGCGSGGFYHRFIELAKSVWLLHSLAFACNPTASVFQVRRDTDFHSDFMESAEDAGEVTEEEDANGVEVQQQQQQQQQRRGLRLVPKVGFTVVPGFRLEWYVVKCLVYLLPRD